MLLAACEAPTQRGSADGGCLFDVQSLPTVGESGRLGLGYFPAAGQSLDRPMAAHGARTNLMVFSSIDVTAVDDVRSSAPAIATFKLAAIAESSCQRQYLITVVSGDAGSAELIAVDARGSEIDRAALHVEETSAIEIDRGWSGAGPTIVAGSLQGLHATTLGDSGVLVGTGAVRFSLAGSLTPFPDRAQEPPWWGGDSVTFTGIAGSGVISADADRAHVEVPVNVIASLGEVTMRVEKNAVLSNDVFVSAGDLFGAECDWDWDRGWNWVDGGWIGSQPQTHYRFTVDKAGTYTALCKLPDGQERAIELTFE
jgi:hypothetical protein